MRVRLGAVLALASAAAERMFEYLKKLTLLKTEYAAGCSVSEAGG